MRVLIVCPVEQGAGETITALHVAENLVARGHEVRFLASPFARRFLDGRFAAVTESLGEDGPANVAQWDATLAAYPPDAIVFADYPLLFFPQGVSRLADEEGWLDRLLEVDATLITLDHFGFAQGEMGLFMGPAHLTPFNYQRFPALPERMRVMLPCPMHEPGGVAGRRGDPFRYWDVPLGIGEGLRRDVRSTYLTNPQDHLILHTVPNWAWQAADALGLSFYRFLPRLFEAYLAGLHRPVTIVSVNNGRLLEPVTTPGVRILNLGPLPTADFEALLFGSDLVLTENKVSISMGKAICGLQPSGALKNSHRLPDLLANADPLARQVVLDMENARPGTVYPYDVFPSGFAEGLRDLVLYRDNSLTKAFAELEVFDVAATGERLRTLLEDEGARADLRANQQTYVDRLAMLGDGADVLERIVDEQRAVA